MFNDLHKEIILRKPNGLIYLGDDNRTVRQMKTYNVFLYYAQEVLINNLSVEYFTIPLSEFKALVGCKWSNNIDLKKNLTGLLQVRVKFNISNKDSRVDWGDGRLLSEAELRVNTDRKREIRYAFPKEIRQALVECNLFMRMENI
jgi:hypothetical protein